MYKISTKALLEISHDLVNNIDETFMSGKIAHYLDKYRDVEDFV